jgi:hypothetical protein
MADTPDQVIANNESRTFVLMSTAAAGQILRDPENRKTVAFSLGLISVLLVVLFVMMGGFRGSGRAHVRQPAGAISSLTSGGEVITGQRLAAKPELPAVSREPYRGPLLDDQARNSFREKSGASNLTSVDIVTMLSDEEAIYEFCLEKGLILCRMRCPKCGIGNLVLPEASKKVLLLGQRTCTDCSTKVMICVLNKQLSQEQLV